MQPNFLTDTDNMVIGTITENQLMLYGFLVILGIILVALVAGLVKKKNEPHIKTTIKELL